MTIISNRFLAAAQPGPDPDLIAQQSARRAASVVAGCLGATLLVAPLAAGVWAGGNTPKAPANPGAVAPSVITDSPPPAYVLRLERDPFR